MFFILLSREPEIVGDGFRSARNVTQAGMFHVEHLHRMFHAEQERSGTVYTNTQTINCLQSITCDRLGVAIRVD